MLATMSRQAAECSLTTLSSDRKTWFAQGIAQREGIVGMDLTHRCREWLNTHVGEGRWNWDWMWEENETEMNFISERDAMLFKLTWM